MSATIFALATGASRAAVAVVRISGPETQAVLHKMAGGAPIPRRAALRQLQRPDTGEVLDQGLVFWFPGPASYTGEDSAEFHVHGGRAVVETVLDTLVRQGLRCAEPGEFTRRAFQNGKLDLTQAEAVADLVDAETDAQRRQALGQLRGDLARRHADWRLILVEALAVLEAAVDFPDEEVPETVADEAAPALADLAMELDAALQDAVRGERVRDGYRIAVIGAPNAGKSSLLNALVGRDAAIVTPAAGTTRDIIEIEQDWGGFRVILADTAGLRDASDPAEIEGVRRARAWASDAALRLWVVDAAAGEDAWREAISLARSGDLCVLNKSDLPSGPASDEASTWARTQGLGLASVSASSGSGVVGLKEALTARVAAALTGVEFPAVTRERHVRDLTLARSHVARALAALSLPVQVELAAEDVRLAARSLARISGRIDPEDVLDRVFARFCIGK